MPLTLLACTPAADAAGLPHHRPAGL